MKKISILLVLFAFVAVSYGQMAIPGITFADNASRFNGRKVTVKEVKLSTEITSISMGAVAPAPLAGAIQMPTVAPGPNGSGNVAVRCNPPRGFKKVNIEFVGAPNYQGCFFMQDAMYKVLERELGGQSVDAQITFRGDSRTGYNVSFYRLGK